MHAQSCPTLCDPMDCSPPGSSVHGNSPGKNTGVGCHAFLQGIFPTQGSNPGLLAWQADSLPSEPPSTYVSRNSKRIHFKRIHYIANTFRPCWKETYGYSNSGGHSELYIGYSLQDKCIILHISTPMLRNLT